MYARLAWIMVRIVHILSDGSVRHAVSWLMRLIGCAAAYICQQWRSQEFRLTDETTPIMRLHP